MFSLFKRKKPDIDYEKLPQHVAVIMDGNGRWAKRRGLPRTAGHSAGAKAFEKLIENCANLGIKYLTVYAFSTENWKRPKEEVDALMALLEDYLENGLDRLDKTIRVKVIGDISKFSEKFREKIKNIEERTKDRNGLCLNIALNYGGKSEITNAVRNIVKDVQDGKIKRKDIDENLISTYLYTAGQPEPDLIIRPSGEYRISNFLLWQCAYSEFWFSNVLWPDFSMKHLKEAILDYQNRSRRFGGI